MAADVARPRPRKPGRIRSRSPAGSLVGVTERGAGQPPGRKTSFWTISCPGPGHRRSRWAIKKKAGLPRPAHCRGGHLHVLVGGRRDQPISLPKRGCAGAEGDRRPEFHPRLPAGGAHGLQGKTHRAGQIATGRSRMMRLSKRTCARPPYSPGGVCRSEGAVTAGRHLRQKHPGIVETR